MSLFDEYYNEYLELVKKTSDQTAELLNSNPFSSDAHEKSSREIEETLENAGDVVKQMEIHGRSLRKQQNREIILERAKGYRQTLKGLKSEYESARAQHEREMLFCSGNGGGGDVETGTGFSEETRDSMRRTSDILSRSGERIQQSISLISDTEDVGKDIATELARSRDKIESASARVKSVDLMADQARHTLRLMGLHETQHRVIVVGVVLTLLVGGGYAAFSVTW